MLTAPELEDLMQSESDRVELKAAPSDAGEIRRVVCAFANDLAGHGQPGVLLVGVDDRGRPTGLPITDELLRTLSDIRTDGQTLPPPRIQVRKESLRGVSVAVVEVSPSDAPPVRYKGQVWVRIGPRQAIATAEEERRLAERAVSTTLTFDRRPCLFAALGDLNVELFRERYLPRAVDSAVLLENGRTVEEQLASLRLFDLRSNVPTYGGIIAFGVDPIAHVPGAYVQVIRFEGTDRASRVVDSKLLTGHLLAQIQQVVDVIRLQIRVESSIGNDMQRVDRADFPPDALREIVLNALVHRTYEGTSAPVRISWFADRVEVQNPGGLYGQVTPENFGRTCDYRNPILAEVMKVSGWVERFGTGIERVRRALAANGNPEPRFVFEPTGVTVTLVRRGGLFE